MAGNSSLIEQTGYQARFVTAHEYTEKRRIGKGGILEPVLARAPHLCVARLREREASDELLSHQQLFNDQAI